MLALFCSLSLSWPFQAFGFDAVSCASRVLFGSFPAHSGCCPLCLRCVFHNAKLTAGISAPLDITAFLQDDFGLSYYLSFRQLDYLRLNGVFFVILALGAH